MKPYLAIGLILSIVAFGAFQIHVYRASADRALPVDRSSSQIFIHGTPVCVYDLDGNIVAKVGPCEEPDGTRSGGSRGENPDSGHPAMKLPPAHPPVTPDMEIEGRRRILI